MVARKPVSNEALYTASHASSASMKPRTVAVVPKTGVRKIRDPPQNDKIDYSAAKRRYHGVPEPCSTHGDELSGSIDRDRYHDPQDDQGYDQYEDCGQGGWKGKSERSRDGC